MPHAFTPTRRRGRPRKEPATETGTPELVYKRACQLTAESIDLCLERQLITQMQHWCGLHLRWLHTIRFGAPGISALDLTRVTGNEWVPPDDPRWHSAREEEYQEAIAMLRDRQSLKIVSAVCIYNERPHFLSKQWQERALHRPATAIRMDHELGDLREGLQSLARLWNRNRPSH